MTANVDVPVLIVGAGPVGLATALVLGRFGVRSLVCEQYTGINRHPRAHVVNTRSMELLRAWGLEAAVAADAVDPRWMMNIMWKDRLAGSELGRINLTDAPAEHVLARLTASPCMVSSCAQDRVQQHLLDAALAQGLATVRWETTVVDVADAPDGIDVSVQPKQGPGETVRASYVVAADGARASMRDRLGIEVEGIGAIGQMVNIYFHADLSPWMANDPALLVWILNSRSAGVFIGMDGARRWTFNRAFDPNRESLADYDPDRCVRLLRDAVGSADVAIDIQSVGTWTMAIQTAARYRRGRVFLAGDVAHQFPPTGGLGMNTGLADADNLAWKLAAVLQGWAPEALLDTYEAERRPVALDNTRHSFENVVKMSAAGFGPEAPAVVARLESADPQVAGDERARLASVIPEQRPHFDALGQEIGYVYGDTSVRDAHAASIYRPSVAPGARLPHAWVHRNGERISTLDLVGLGFTLIVGPAGDAWASALMGIAPGVPIQTVMIGRDLTPEDAHGLDLLQLGAEGAILIRPDAHVAWHTDGGSQTPGRDLTAALARALARAE